MTEFSLALTTRVAPPKKFTIDGAEYDLLGTDHLTPDQESETLALFARHTLLQRELELTGNVMSGKGVAAKLRKARLLIIGKLTTVPQSVLETLPLGAQVALLETIQSEIEGDNDGIEDDESPGGEGEGDV